ncbi:MAG: hypothetical protein ACYC3L_01580, partial [Gemmatimonadaceae bacterium]
VLVGILGLALLGLVAGLWLAWDGLRRRVGIPFVEHRPGAWPDTLSAGVGLAGTLVALLGLLRWFSMPTTPTSFGEGALDAALPWLDPLLSLPLSVVMGVLLPALVVFVVLLLARRPAARMALVVVMALMVAGARMAVGGAGTTVAHPVLLVVATVTALPVGYLALRHYAATSAMTWFIAATLAAAFGGARGVLVAATADERIGAALMLGGCGVLVAMARRYVMRDPSPVGLADLH